MEAWTKAWRNIWWATANTVLVALGFPSTCWEVCRGCSFRDRHTWLRPWELRHLPMLPQDSSWQEAGDAPELSNNWKVASRWCEVNQGQLLLLGDVVRTPTWLCKPGHATAGGPDSAGPSLGLFVLPAWFSSTVLSVNVDSCPSQTQGEAATFSPDPHPSAWVYQVLPPLVSTTLGPLAHQTLHSRYSGPQAGLYSLPLEPAWSATVHTLTRPLRARPGLPWLFQGKAESLAHSRCSINTSWLANGWTHAWTEHAQRGKNSHRTGHGRVAPLPTRPCPKSFT